jgi:hypothetical protein
LQHRARVRGNGALADLVATQSALQNSPNPHEHWLRGVDADGLISQEPLQWHLIPESFSRSSDRWPRTISSALGWIP